MLRREAVRSLGVTAWALLVALSATALAPSAAAAAPESEPQAPGAQDPVVGIDVRSADPMLVKPARDAIEQLVGVPYDIDAVRDSLQNIHALGTV
ncbi:MAG: hypothetical protein R3344_15590, partial [Acidobacteriota bacterium]|nr:hypothetical protein [Acidobacteriota bacterium]